MEQLLLPRGSRSRQCRSERADDPLLRRGIENREDQPGVGAGEVLENGPPEQVRDHRRVVCECPAPPGSENERVVAVKQACRENLQDSAKESSRKLAKSFRESRRRATAKGAGDVMMLTVYGDSRRSPPSSRKTGTSGE